MNKRFNKAKAFAQMNKELDWDFNMSDFDFIRNRWNNNYRTFESKTYKINFTENITNAGDRKFAKDYGDYLYWICDKTRGEVVVLFKDNGEIENHLK